MGYRRSSSIVGFTAAYFAKWQQEQLHSRLSVGLFADKKNLLQSGRQQLIAVRLYLTFGETDLGRLVCHHQVQEINQAQAVLA